MGYLQMGWRQVLNKSPSHILVVFLPDYVEDVALHQPMVVRHIDCRSLHSYIILGG
jgi:hypothetical protein